MGLKFAVITSVNRDDREDGGAELFALVIIDFDWRYRLPIMPLLLILSAFGLTALRHHRASA